MAGYVPVWFHSVMSLRLIAALEDLGVTELIIGRRRHTFLQDESALTMNDQICGENVVSYHFRSMTEGTTTPEMGSDIDTLDCDDCVNIMPGWPDWKRGKENLLMVKHATCSLQHYRLQEIRPDLPLPLTVPIDEFSVLDADGIVYRSNRAAGTIMRQLAVALNRPYLNAGPSHSILEMYDFVHAYRCETLPIECESWFTRPRHGIWPTQELLQTARELGCFLLPDGHCNSEYNLLEWRVSPSLIERYLMFSMHLIHLHCYVTLNLLKKDIINPYLNGDGKLTSFHCKTALFYAREQLVSEICTADRLFDCILYCLNLMREWTISGHFPLYIMNEVNLFDGKLNSEQRARLRTVLNIIIDTHLAPLAFVKADDLGVRLLNNVYTVAIRDMKPRRAIHQEITGFLSVYGNVFHAIRMRHILTEAADNTPDELCLFLHSLITAMTQHQLHRHGSEHALCRIDGVNKDYIIRYLQQHLASTAASICLQHGMHIGNRILSWYSAAKDTDVASTRLKLGSMFYCKGDLQMAADVLDDVERRYDNTVQAICGCGRMDPLVGKPRKKFTEFLYECDTDFLLTNRVAYCVRFLRQEVYCAPQILHFEMVRGAEDDIQHRRPFERGWMNWAVVDSRPFLHYLQYLTFRDLGLRYKQEQALQSLRVSINDGIKQKQVYHPETATNLFAHCLELEGRIDDALGIYSVLQAAMPRNNAANLHIRRLTNVL